MTEIEATIQIMDYDSLIARAVEIAAVNQTYVDNSELARLKFGTVNGERVAILQWPEEKSGYYDSCSVETQVHPFPVELLVLGADEFAAWREKQNRERAAKEDAARQGAAHRLREVELARLAQLKAKYPNA